MRILVGCLALVTVGSLAMSFAIGTPEATTTVVAVATLPPAPTPLPPLRLPQQNIFRSTTSQPGMATAAKLDANALLPVAYGVIGVSIDQRHPDESVASILGPHGVRWVHIGSHIGSAIVTTIGMDGLHLNTGAIIPRSLGVGTAPEANVPAIAQNSLPSPSPPPGLAPHVAPTPTQAGTFTAPTLLNPITLPSPSVVSPNALPSRRRDDFLNHP
ncbi:MAG: hypothetical protein ACYDHD_02640 [Vulcanimicrobiaceae bacterium]